LRQDAGLRQSIGVGQRAFDIFENKPLVDAKRAVEAFEDCVDLFGESAAPGLHD
jgi:hypothetical protein